MYRFGKASSFSSALVTRLEKEQSRAEITKLGTEPSRGHARLFHCRTKRARTGLCSFISFSSGIRIQRGHEIY